jgi:site-specific recombinase XerD
MVSILAQQRWLLEREGMVKKQRARRRPWNKGREVGKKGAFTPAQVKRIRQILVARGVPGLRDLALFQAAIDTMLHGPDLFNLTVKDVQLPNGKIRSLIKVPRRSGMPPVRCAFSKTTAAALGKWITMSRARRADYLFPGRRTESSHPMGVRQMNRLLKFWIAEAGLDPKKYGNESLRRTKALHILKGTGDLEMVRILLGHAKIESTARFLRVPTTSDPISVSRAFDI